METQKKTVTVTHEDLDRALAQPWSPQTCLLAQAGERQRLDYGPQFDVLWGSASRELMEMFDEYHRPSWGGQKDEMFLAMLEAVLPMEFKVEVEV
jgi:hypothetical protein